VDEISRLLEIAIAETASNDAKRIHWEKMAGDARLCINLARTKYGSSNPELSARLAEAVRNISKFSKANDVTRLQTEYQIAVTERDRLHASIPDMTIYKDLQPAASLLIEPSSSFAAAAAAVNKETMPSYYRARESFARNPPTRPMETRDFGQQADASSYERMLTQHQADAEAGGPIMLDTLQTVNGRMRQRADSLEAERQMQQQQAAALRSYSTYEQRDNVDFAAQSSSALNEREQQQQQQQQQAAAREQSYTDVPSDTGLFVATAQQPPPSEEAVVVPEQAVAAGLFVAAAAVLPPPAGARPPPPPPPPPGGIESYKLKTHTAAAKAAAAPEAAAPEPEAAAAAVVPVARRQVPRSVEEELRGRLRNENKVSMLYNDFLSQFKLDANDVYGHTNVYTKLWRKYLLDGLLTMEQAAEVKRAVLAAKRAAPPPPAAERRPGPAAAAAMLSVPVDNFKSSNAFLALERQQAADAETAELKRALMARRGGIAPEDVKEGASSNDDEWEDEDGKQAGAPVNPHATKLIAATAGSADAEPLDLRGPPRGAIFAAAAAAAAAATGAAAAGGVMPASGAMFAAVPRAAAADVYEGSY
jgi:hypothetical protein